jgi:Flp pilus assembly protein TadG
MKKILSKLKDQKGQSAVEFTLVLVFVFLPLLFGITEFSRAFYHADLLKGESNVAARTYAVQGAVAGNTARDSLINIAQARDGRTIAILFTADTSSVTAAATETFQSPFLDPVLDLLQTWLGGSRPHFFPMSLTRTATYRLES